MLEVNIPSGKREVSVFGLTQWDKGQKLSLSFENMPESFQVHFSSRGKENAVVVEASRQGERAVVDIPDEMLIYDSDIIAWIYFTGENTGETVGRITLYVRPRPRPQGFMEELVPSQQQLVENMIKEIKSNLDYLLSNGADSEYVPSYVMQESLEAAKKVLACQNEDTVSFFASADYHYDLADTNTCKSISHMASAMKLISAMCKIDFSVCLGGYIADRSDKSKEDALNEHLQVNQALRQAVGDIPSLRAVGGDDLLSAAYYRNGECFDCDELYNLIGKWCSAAVSNPNDKRGGYCYTDFEKARLRVICLNTSDFKKDDIIRPETDKAHMSSEQLIWLCSALDLSGKTDTAAWSTVILSHYPANYYDSFSGLKAVVKAYTSGKSVELLGSDGREISYDFSRGNNSAPILAFLSGALHNFKVNVLEGTSIPLITIPNAGIGDENYFADEMYSAEESLLYGENASWDKTAFSAEDTAFCIVTLDKKAGKLFLHCYGAGYDREIEFDAISQAPSGPSIPGTDNPGDSGDAGNEGSNEGENEVGSEGGSEGAGYTNLVPGAIDEYGDIFARCGYTDGQYMDYYGDTYSASGFTLTGFIPVTNGDVIRIKGGNWSDVDGNTIIAYDSDFCDLWSEVLNGSAIAESGISYNGTVALFESLNVTTGNLSDMAYIRISCKGDGESLIVTRNQEITSSGGGTAPPVTDYDNIIVHAVDEYGDSYNRGLGYMDGYALCDDGSVSSAANSSFTHTGYIYAEKGDFICLKGGTFTSEQGNYLIVYDMDFNHCFTVAIGGEVNQTTKGITFSAGVMTFDTTKVTSESLPDEFFFRVSTKAKGENLIMTYNSKIS